MQVTCHLLSMQQIKVNIKSLAGSWEVPLGDALDPYLIGNHVYISPGTTCHMLLNRLAALKGELAHAWHQSYRNSAVEVSSCHSDFYPPPTLPIFTPPIFT